MIQLRLLKRLFEPSSFLNKPVMLNHTRKKFFFYDLIPRIGFKYNFVWSEEFCRNTDYIFWCRRLTSPHAKSKLSLIFFFFFFSVFLNRPIKVFFVHLIVVACTCRSILGHTWENVCGKCSIDLKLLCENITCHVL